MYTFKLIQTNVEFTDPGLIYTDTKAAILDNIKQRLEGKCYMSCLILEIVEIIKHGILKYSPTRLNGSASCSVLFKVRCMVIIKHEILLDCKVINIDKDGHTICKNKHAAIYIEAHNALQTVKKGQTIIVKALECSYPIGMPTISVKGLPFIPVPEPNIIYSMVVNNTQLIQDLITELNAEIKQNNLLDKTIHKFFTDLLYPYKNKKNYEAALKNPLLKIKDMRTVEGKIIMSKPDWVPKNEPVFIIHTKIDTTDIIGSDELKATDNGIYVVEDYAAIITNMITNYISYLTTIRQLCTVYNTETLIAENSNIWDTYTKYKL